MTRVTALMAAAGLASVAGDRRIAAHAGGAGPGVRGGDDGDGRRRKRHLRDENHIVIDDGSDTVRICYTITNTGARRVTPRRPGRQLRRVVGPGDATVVEPGESWSVTATGANMVSMFHEWTATGADSGIEVVQMTDYVYITMAGARGSST